MTKSKTQKKRSIPLIIFLVTAIAVVLFVLVIFIYQLNNPYPTNSEQCEVDSRNITAEERMSPLYEPPVACLYSIHEPNAPYTFAR